MCCCRRHRIRARGDRRGVRSVQRLTQATWSRPQDITCALRQFVSSTCLCCTMSQRTTIAYNLRRKRLGGSKSEYELELLELVALPMNNADHTLRPVQCTTTQMPTSSLDASRSLQRPLPHELCTQPFIQPK